MRSARIPLVLRPCSGQRESLSDLTDICLHGKSAVLPRPESLAHAESMGDKFPIRVDLRITSEQLAALDERRRQGRDLPTRQEMIRRLLDELGPPAAPAKRKVQRR